MRVEVWNRANTSKVADLDTTDSDGNLRQIEDLTATGQKLNETGSGGVVIQADHPELAEATPGRCLRLYDGDDLVWTWTIEERQTVRHAASHAAEKVRLEGKGLLARWAEAVVYPWLGRNGAPTSTARVWNFASPSLDDSGWGGVFIQDRVFPLQRLPEGWPIAEQFGFWINTRAWTSGAHPVGDTLLRKRFTLATTQTIVIYCAADDNAEVWLDGVRLGDLTTEPDNSGNERTHKFVLRVTSGAHVIAVKLTNWDTGSVNPSSFICAVFKVEGDVIADQAPIFTSSADTFDWMGLDYPDPKPGFTAVEILDELLEEAQTRGGIYGPLAGWTIEEHGTHTPIPEFVATVGDTYLQVIESLAATDIDVAADLEGLVLHVWPKGEMGSLVDAPVALGVNLEYLSETVDDEFYNAVLGKWSKGVRSISNTVSVIANGRRETTLELGQVTERDTVDRICNAYLDAWSVPVRSVVVKHVPTDGVRAGVDFGVGDTITVDGEQLRCVGIAWELDDSGELRPVGEFDTALALRRAEKLRAVDAMVARFDSPATAQITDWGTNIASGKVQTQTVNWSWSGDIDEALSDRSDPDAPWQPAEVGRVMRICSFEVGINPADLPDAFDDSTFTLNKNETLIDGLLNLKLDTTTWAAKKQVSAWTVVRPTDTFHPACIEAGGHVDGTVTVRLADAV